MTIQELKVPPIITFNSPDSSKRRRRQANQNQQAQHVNTATVTSFANLKSDESETTKSHNVEYFNPIELHQDNDKLKREVTELTAQLKELQELNNHLSDEIISSKQISKETEELCEKQLAVIESLESNLVHIETLKERSSLEIAALTNQVAQLQLEISQTIEASRKEICFLTDESSQLQFEKNNNEALIIAAKESLESQATFIEAKDLNDQTEILRNQLNSTVTLLRKILITGEELEGVKPEELSELQKELNQEVAGNQENLNSCNATLKSIINSTSRELTKRSELANHLNETHLSISQIVILKEWLEKALQLPTQVKDFSEQVTKLKQKIQTAIDQHVSVDASSYQNYDQALKQLNACKNTLEEANLKEVISQLTELAEIEQAPLNKIEAFQTYTPEIHHQISLSLTEQATIKKQLNKELRDKTSERWNVALHDLKIISSLLFKVRADREVITPMRYLLGTIAAHKMKVVQTIESFEAITISSTTFDKNKYQQTYEQFKKDFNETTTKTKALLGEFLQLKQTINLKTDKNLEEDLKSYAINSHTPKPNVEKEIKDVNVNNANIIKTINQELTLLQAKLSTELLHAGRQLDKWLDALGNNGKRETAYFGTSYTVKATLHKDECEAILNSLKEESTKANPLASPLPPKNG